MPKLTFMTVVVAALAALVGYLIFHPTAAEDVTGWVQRKSGIEDNLPDPKSLPAANYMPVVPAK